MIFLIVVFGFWFLNVGSGYLGEIVVEYLLEFFPNMHLVFVVPIVGVVLVIFIASLLAYFREQINLNDIKVLYGNLIKKLEELISDMEELRK